jgi:hypothetical protein
MLHGSSEAPGGTSYGLSQSAHTRRDGSLGWGVHDGAGASAGSGVAQAHGHGHHDAAHVSGHTKDGAHTSTHMDSANGSQPQSHRQAATNPGTQKASGHSVLRTMPSSPRISTAFTANSAQGASVSHIYGQSPRGGGTLPLTSSETSSNRGSCDSPAVAAIREAAAAVFAAAAAVQNDGSAHQHESDLRAAPKLAQRNISNMFENVVTKLAKATEHAHKFEQVMYADAL